jgi:6-phosphogluconate dehydrogenase
MPGLALIGLGAMGRNLAANLHGQGVPLAVYSYAAAEVDRLRRELPDPPPTARSLRELLGKLTPPRTIFLMVTAGDPVDAVVADLLPWLDAGDVIIDGGNSHFEDTERRAAALAAQGIGYLGVGISGGEEGARHGASVMVGGAMADYQRLRSLFQALAAPCGTARCEAWLGPGGAGHFVKMVHNGIEYALMQSIAEAWEFLAEGLGLPPARQRAVFEQWSKGPLASYLIEITARILGFEHSPGVALLEVVSDRAAQKGTGRWTLEAALALGVPVPTIAAAVNERLVSALPDRPAAGGRRGAGVGGRGRQSAEHWVAALEQALLGAFLATFDQGFRLLAAASTRFDWRLDLPAIARVWQGGCIIRAVLLEQVERAEDPARLLTAPAFAVTLANLDAGWRRVVGAGIAAGMTAPALVSALAYHDGIRAARLPTRLVQAQRDYFGAHGYERVDRSGRFNGPWNRP